MAETRVYVRTVQDSSVAVGWAGHRTLTIDRAEEAGGLQPIRKVVVMVK